jgi:heptaprenylglyceryl phosphate synthase
MKPIVIVFQIGGTTFTEAAESLAYPDAKVVVGGTFIHNSKSMLGEIIQIGQAEQEL